MGSPQNWGFMLLSDFSSHGQNCWKYLSDICVILKGSSTCVGISKFWWPSSVLGGQRISEKLHFVGHFDKLRTKIECLVKDSILMIISHLNNNPAQQRVATLMRPKPLPLNQTATIHYILHNKKYTHYLCEQSILGNQARYICWINNKQETLTSNSSRASNCDCKTGNVFNSCNQTW